MEELYTKPNHKIYYIDRSNDKNRCIRASKDIKVGQCIIDCIPIEAIPFTSTRTSFCNYCLNVEENLMKCSQCKTNYYCS